jgi:hypothetical protein
VKYGKAFQLISRYVKSHQDDERDYADLTRPEQLNVEATEPRLHSTHFVRLNSEFYPLPACEPISADATGYITVEIRTLRTELPEYELSIPSKNAKLV